MRGKKTHDLPDMTADTPYSGIWYLPECILSVKVQQNVGYILRLGGLVITFVLGIEERQFALLRGEFLKPDCNRRT